MVRKILLLCKIFYSFLLLTNIINCQQENKFSIRHIKKKYKGCLLYFRISEKKHILIIENHLIVFQKIPHEDLFTFVWTNCQNTHATLIQVSLKYEFWIGWPLSLLFIYGNKKKSFGAKLVLCGGLFIRLMLWVLKNTVNELMVAGIIILKSDLFSVFGFPDFLEDSWQTNIICIPLKYWLFYIGMVATCPVFLQKQANIAWKCFMGDQLEIPIQPTTVYS